MTRKLAFDTLQYFKKLENAGVQHAVSHSEALAEALNQNIYTKSEIDSMLDVTIKQFEAAIKELKEELKDFRRDRIEMRLEFKADLQKTMNHYMIGTISILGTLIIAVETISNWILHFNLVH